MMQLSFYGFILLAVLVITAVSFYLFMNHKSTYPLVDVVKLSASRCTTPIKAELRYATDKNFVGRVLNGYDPAVAHVALLTKKAATSLCDVQNDLIKNYGYGLLVYDAFRPKRAVQDILQWSQQQVANDYELMRKAKHYPNVDKTQLFELGYVAEDSGHCYGNTVDVVLIDIATGKELDMGARFDFMDEKSHRNINASQIGENAHRNREILSNAMQKFGFEPYEKEFWHFSFGGIKGREVAKPMDVTIREAV